MSEDKPVVIELATGEQYGVASEAVAAKTYPDAKIVGYQDGSPYGDQVVEGEAAPNPATMKRDELNQYAIANGIADPASYGTKEQLLEALNHQGGE
jgi:hypothetical protein